MSLTYLYKKLEKMDEREQYCYIQNIFRQFQIRPKFNIDEIFKNTKAKQSLHKNPLGYIAMHLTIDQLQQLVPEYLVQLCNGNTFNSNDLEILTEIDLAAEGDLNYQLLMFEQTDISQIMQVFDFGVGKYSPWSFLELNEYTLIPALFRHLYKYCYISKTDEETGLSHLAHAACNVRMIELIKQSRDK